MNPGQALALIHDIWKPHDTQLEVGHAIFHAGKKRIFLECARKWGKGEILAYIIWRWCLTHHNHSCYYMAPFAKQAREILWANRRIQNFAGPLSHKIWAKKPNDQQMRVPFQTGSWIKLDGSDNVDSYRGINPHLMIYDEFKDFKTEFHEAMEPNLTSFEAPLIIAGTPPKTSDNQFTQVAEEISNDPNGAYFNFPSSNNPHLSKAWLNTTRERLFALGDEDVWYREYEAKRVVGGRAHIIPTFRKENNVKPHAELELELARDRPKLIWITIADPGTVTVFGCLFMAVNPYNKKVYILDEVYAEEQAETSTAKIFPEIKKKQHGLVGDEDVDWLQVCDCAAAWFINEMLATYGEYWIPSDKTTVKKDPGIGLIKDQCFRNLAVVSDRCKKLIWELENYIKDKNGNIPKKNDHLIDCWRYGNSSGGMDLLPANEPEEIKPDHRGFTLAQDLEMETPKFGEESDYYEY
jgi:hypothetical protein